MLGERKSIRLIATSAAFVAALAGGCRTDREVTQPEPQKVTQERLTEALLTEDDVGSPYVVAGEATPISSDILPEHDCDDALKDLEPKEEAAIDFTGTGLGTRLNNAIAYFPGRGSSVGEVYREVAEDCEAVVVDDAGLSIKTESLDFGVLSDDTLAFQFLVEAEDGSIEERDLIVIRIDDLVSIIRLDGPRPSDKELLDSVVRVAIGNLGLVAEET